MLVLMNIPLVHWELKENLWKQYFSAFFFVCVLAKCSLFFFLFPHQRELFRIFVAASQTQGEGEGELRYQESGTKADKRAGGYSEIPGR